MTKDYGILLQNLLGRRYDEAKRESIVSDSFDECTYGDCVKYTLEAMQEIDPSYAYKTYAIAKKIQDKIEIELEKRNFPAEYRYQGPLQTETHILLYGDVELIVLVSPSPQEKPWQSVQLLAQELMDILTKDVAYQAVDYSDKHKIRITSMKPTCEVTVQPAVWLNNPDFLQTKREIERGICDYNMEKKIQRKYLPFKHIARINTRDRKTNGGLKSLIRLLRTLQRDAQEAIDLTDYEIAGLVYAIPDEKLRYSHQHILSLLHVALDQLHRLVTDEPYRTRLLSPSEKELVFGTKPKLPHIQALKTMLEELVSDLETELQEHNKDLASQISY